MFDWLALTPTDGLVHLRDMIDEYPTSILRFQHYTLDKTGRIQRCDPVAWCFYLDFGNPDAMDSLLDTLDVKEFCQAWSKNEVAMFELRGYVQYEIERRSHIPEQLRDSVWNSLPEFANAA